jgi:hypothetical protein
MLQQWTDQGKVRLDDTTLTLLAEQRTVTLLPAVRFTKLIDGGADPHALLGKVKTRDQLVELGAEHYMDSVILGDVGYTVLEGFLGDLSPAPRATTAPALAPATPVKEVVAPVAVHVAAPVMAPPPGASTPAPTAALPPAPAPKHAPPPTPAPVVLPARPVTEADDDAAALSALFLSTVRER